jgi:hypothetical protein
MSDSLAPSEIVVKLIDIDAAKSQHTIPDLLIRSSPSGALLGFGAGLALLAALIKSDINPAKLSHAAFAAELTGHLVDGVVLIPGARGQLTQAHSVRHAMDRDDALCRGLRARPIVSPSHTGSNDPRALPIAG